MLVNFLQFVNGLTTATTRVQTFRGANLIGDSKLSLVFSERNVSHLSIMFSLYSTSGGEAAEAGKLLVLQSANNKVIE